MIRACLLLFALGAHLLASPAAAAPDTPTGWRLLFYAAAIDFEDSASLASSGYTRFRADVGGGVGLHAEYLFSPRLGVEVGFLNGSGIDVEAATFCDYFCVDGWATVGTLAFSSLTTGLDIHLTRGHRVDVYAAPLLALVRYGDLSLLTVGRSTRIRLEFDDDVALGAALGMSVPLGDGHWTFDTRLSYLDSTLSGKSGSDLSINRGYDSTAFGLGFGYRFGSRARS